MRVDAATVVVQPRAVVELPTAHTAGLARGQVSVRILKWQIIKLLLQPLVKIRDVTIPI